MPTFFDDIEEEENSPIMAYVDGSCIGNPGHCGLAMLLIDGEEETAYSKYIGMGTNNVAELKAVEYALDVIKETDREIWFYSDSQYAIGVLSMDWNVNANKELVSSIKEKMKKFKTKFIKVNGHSKDRKNARVDKLAYRAAGEHE